MIQAEVHEDANIIFGTVVDESMGDEIRITVIATGFESAESAARAGVASLGGFRRPPGNIAVPTFIRNEKPADALPPLKTDTAEDDSRPDLEIPTFLRRQAD
jgi:cell division protein FtsZ